MNGGNLDVGLPPKCVGAVASCDEYKRWRGVCPCKALIIPAAEATFWAAGGDFVSSPTEGDRFLSGKEGLFALLLGLDKTPSFGNAILFDAVIAFAAFSLSL